MSDTTKAGESELDRGIFPNTKSFYKAFIDYMPTPTKAPNDSYYLEYSRTLSAAQKANKEVRQVTKEWLAAERTKLVDELISKLPEKKYMDTWDAYANTVIDQVSHLLKTYREGMGNLDE